MGIYSLMTGTLVGAFLQLVFIATLFFRRYCSVSPLHCRNLLDRDMSLVLRKLGKSVSEEEFGHRPEAIANPGSEPTSASVGGFNLEGPCG